VATWDEQARFGLSPLWRSGRRGTLREQKLADTAANARPILPAMVTGDLVIWVQKSDTRRDMFAQLPRQVEPQPQTHRGQLSRRPMWSPVNVFARYKRLTHLDIDATWWPRQSGLVP